MADRTQTREPRTLRTVSLYEYAYTNSVVTQNTIILHHFHVKEQSKIANLGTSFCRPVAWLNYKLWQEVLKILNFVFKKIMKVNEYIGVWLNHVVRILIENKYLCHAKKNGWPIILATLSAPENPAYITN